MYVANIQTHTANVVNGKKKKKKKIVCFPFSATNVWQKTNNLYTLISKRRNNIISSFTAEALQAWSHKNLFNFFNLF